MWRRTDMKRRVAWAVVAGVFALAFMLASAPATKAEDGPVIDTATFLRPSQCVPCHTDLGDVQVPGITFSHGNHLLVSCDGCHSRMPHRGDATERVPMEVCFACHGVSHGAQGELATRKCNACHTPAFKLRPKTHTKSWAKSPHAEAANRGGVNACMMCHEAAKDCDGCHAKQAPDVPKMPAAFHSLITPRPKGPSIKIFPRGKVSMSQCIYCHTDIDKVVPGRLIFAHATHIQRNYRCETCHPKFAHSESGVDRPDMRSCYRCHGLNHNSGGQVATDECGACHPKQFNLKPASHTTPFARGDHKKPAAADPAECAMCHASAFCVGCHQGKKVTANSTGKPVIPKDHRQPAWKNRHGSVFLNGNGACGSCHDDASCKRCHKTVMPHPVGWVAKHTPEPGVDSSDCRICHTDRTKCQACHHKRVQSDDLVASNCVKCHPQMRVDPATKIQQKSLAEHAVHFSVSKKEGRRPLRCDDCHLGYGTLSGATSDRASGSASGLPKASHDVKLCYSCHGALDYRNREIAPYPGSSLCVRCHTRLKV